MVIRNSVTVNIWFQDWSNERFQDDEDLKTSQFIVVF